MLNEPHPIEVQSYKLLRAELDRVYPEVAELPPLSRAVVERVVHATGDVTLVPDLVVDEVALQAGRDAIEAGAPLITDVRMTSAGVSGGICAIDFCPVAPAGSTRSRAGMKIALEQADGPVIVVVGCSPTSVWALLDAVESGIPAPVLTVATPVGYVDAVESKTALATSGLPWVGNTNRRGGAAIASAMVNALRYHPRYEGDTNAVRPLTV
ncbi:precorrin-8X methylmutase [Stomatohabitans albus]|uniref:precorrin-8X methylmutase n=1 Tax=Stomatohabitans albus TaxID=3110766 RepID=UPI00300D24C9